MQVAFSPSALYNQAMVEFHLLIDIDGNSSITIFLLGI
jgi:hypothetical protein